MMDIARDAPYMAAVCPRIALRRLPLKGPP